MKRSFGTLAALGLFTAAVFVPLGCSDTSNDPTALEDQTVGSVHLALTGMATVPIATATYTLTGPASFSKMGAVAAAGGGALSGLIGGIPAGVGYSITLSGTATDGSVSCSGSATFDVMAHTTTAVTVPLTCRETINGGSVSVTDTTNVCPVVDGVAATPPAAASNGTVTLNGEAHDKDSGPSALTYHWTATAGTIANANAQDTTFTCPSGAASTNVTVTLTVSDGGPMCTDTMTLVVACGG